MRLAPFNKAAPTAPAEPPACYRYHRNYALATCPECGLRIPGGPYDAEQYARYFHTPMQAQPHPDIGRAAEPSAAHQAAKDALELADAVYQVVVSRLLVVTRRLSGPRTADENEELKASEFTAQEEVREASERSQRARVVFNREDRALGQRILLAQRKAEGRS